MYGLLYRITCTLVFSFLNRESLLDLLNEPFAPDEKLGTCATLITNPIRC